MFVFSINCGYYFTAICDVAMKAITLLAKKDIHVGITIIIIYM